MASKPRLSSRSRRWLSFGRAWAIFAGLVVVAGFLDAFDTLTKTIADVGEWCGAHVVITVLACLFATMGALIGFRRRAAPPSAPSPDPAAAIEAAGLTLTDAHTSADKKTFEELVQRVDRNLVNYLRDHDFGNPWDRELVRELAFYVDGHNEVENTFHDPVVEGHRRDLHAAAARFTGLVGRYGTWSKHLDGYNELASSRRVSEEPPEGEHWDRWIKLQGELNGAAHGVVGAYDGLVTAARRRAP